MSCITVLDILGFHTNDIEHAWEECKDALTSVLLETKTDELEKKLKENIRHVLDFDDPTNSIISEMFKITETIICTEYEDVICNYYVNGYASYIYIYDEEIFRKLHKAGIGMKKIKAYLRMKQFNSMNTDHFIAIANNEYLYNDFLASFLAGNDYEWYTDIEELGNDYSDSDLRDEEDTDSSFGRFLIRAYKDGNSNTIFAQMPDGIIYSAPLVR